VLRARIGHVGDRPPGRRRQVHVDDVSGRGRVRRGVVGVAPRSRLQDLSGPVHDRATPVAHGRVHDGPRLRLKVQRARGERFLLAPGGEHAAVGKHVKVRVQRQAQRGGIETGPAVRLRIVNFGNERNPGVRAVDAPAGGAVVGARDGEDLPAR
jgi:hypothetical protein